jgi:hypothetical protein
MADDSERSDEEMSEEEEEEDFVPIPVNGDLKEGHRVLHPTNRFIEAYFDKKKNQWVYPWYPSKKHPIGQRVDGNQADFLSGAEIVLLAKRFNEFGKNERGTSMYVKMKGREIPDSYIRFLSQPPSETGGKMVLLIVKANKQLVKRTGQTVDICTIFEVLPDGNIIAPEGLVHSRHAFKSTDEIPLLYSGVVSLDRQHMHCIQIFKEMAEEFRKHPALQATPDQHFQIFCLFCSLRSSDVKFANHMMEMAGYATGKTKKDSNEFTITGGSYNTLRASWLTLLYTHSTNITLNDSNPANEMFKKKYDNFFKRKATRQSKKRKHGPEGEDDAPVRYSITMEDRQYLLVDLKTATVVDFSAKWHKLFKDNVRAPKTAKEMWKYLEDKEDDKGEAKKKKFNESIKEYEEHGESNSEAIELALRELQNEVKGDFAVCLRPPHDGDKYIENPMFGWSQEGVESAQKVLMDMIRASLVMASNQMVVMTEKITDEVKEEFFTRFFSPKNKDRIIANDKDAPPVTNIIMLEKAMDNIIQTVLLGNEPLGKNIAIVMAIQYREMNRCIDTMMEKDYSMFQKWIGERILEIPMEEESQSNEFNSYYLPSILSAMVLYITRRIYKHCEVHKWFQLPANMTSSVDIIPFKIPCKSRDLLNLNDKLGGFDDIISAAGEVYDFSQICKDDYLDLLDTNMIIGRRTKIFVPHKMGTNYPVLHLQLCKKINHIGEYSEVIVRPRFPFSIYPIFSECDSAHCTDQLDMLAEALEDHPTINHVHKAIRNLWMEIKLRRPMVYDQVAVWQYLRGTEDEKRREWTSLLEPMDVDMERKNIKEMDFFSVSAIESVLPDIAVTMYMIAGSAIKHVGFSLPALPNKILQTWKNGSVLLDYDSHIQATKTLLQTFFMETGGLVKQYATKAGNRTPAGISIVDDTLRGLVYIGSLDTAAMCTTKKLEFKVLAQIAPLDNVFYKELKEIDRAKENDRLQDMYSENIIINPIVHGITNMEPMSNAAWARTVQVLERMAAAEAPA